MSLTVTAGSAGKHTSAYVERDRRARQAEAENRQLVAGIEDREREIHTALLRGCQDAMLIAQLRAENTAVKAANEGLRHKTVRAQAEQERLRRALINARPKITKVDTKLVRPYITGFRLPYLSAIPFRDTSSDETQELPVLDWPAYGQPSTT